LFVALALSTFLAQIATAKPPSDAPRCTTVRDIRFTRLVYPLPKGWRPISQVRLNRPRYEQPHRKGDESFFYFEIGDIAYGDVNGDGIEDAAVVAFYGSNSGTFHVTDVYVFDCVQNSVALLAVLREERERKKAGVPHTANGYADPRSVHPMRISRGVLEMTYDAAPKPLRYRLVDGAWHRVR